MENDAHAKSQIGRPVLARPIAAGFFSFGALGMALVSLNPRLLVEALLQGRHRGPEVVFAPMGAILLAVITAVVSTKLHLFAEMQLWYDIAAATAGFALFGQLQMVRYLRSLDKDEGEKTGRDSNQG